jgi:hypothetical protein
LELKVLVAKSMSQPLHISIIKDIGQHKNSIKDQKFSNIKDKRDINQIKII